MGAHVEGTKVRARLHSWPLRKSELDYIAGRARLCAYVKHLTLNSAVEQELRDRRVEDRTDATSDP